MGRSMEFVEEILEPTLEYGLEGILKYTKCINIEL